MYDDPIFLILTLSLITIERVIAPTSRPNVTCLSQIYHCTVESIHCLLESTIPLGVATRKHNDYRSKFSFLHVHL